MHDHQLAVHRLCAGFTEHEQRNLVARDHVALGDQPVVQTKRTIRTAYSDLLGEWKTDCCLIILVFVIHRVIVFIL